MTHSSVSNSPVDNTQGLLDRDLSILSFNERVLDWAHRPEVPVLERLRYLCIVSSMWMNFSKFAQNRT
jgi:polyphosphate kinase